ncbi:MAG: response regulator [Piscinibacter sp.]|nr:response regulator [Piscinibacter sp.]
MARILVIEDNKINLELMCYLLRAWGHEVCTAEDGDAGLGAARAESPDLVVCDIQMPGKDGYAVARALRADPATAALRLVAVTAYAMVGDQEKAMQAGFDAHFPKPIEPSAFMAALAPFLPAPGSPPPPAPDDSRRADRMQISPELRAPRPDTTVLLVDDTEANLDFKLSLFEPAGYRTLAARGGQEALQLLRAQRIDLILSDAVMAAGNGYDLLAAVRSSPELHDTPFVFLTATARDSDSRERGLSMGADDYLVRPIEPLALLAAVRAALRR